MKKIISIIVAITMLFLMTASVSANSTGQVRLSELSEKECLAFLTSNGVAIPDVDGNWGAFAKATIAKVEENPGIHFAYGYTYSQDFADAITAVVNEYYGMGESGAAYIQPRSTYTLQDSTVYGSWSDSYLAYNCYAYAIGRTTKINPGDLSGSTMSIEAPISTIANYIKSDLRAIGNECFLISTSIPSSTVLNGAMKTICVRKDTDGNIYGKDYHVMKYSGGSWYHKPGQSIPLQYKYTPTVSRAWTNELSANGVDQAPSRTYESEIYYISYKSAHAIAYRFCGVIGSEYVHVKVCTSCNEQIEGETSCVFLSGSNRCQGCGVQKSDVSVNRETNTEEIS